MLGKTERSSWRRFALVGAVGLGVALVPAAHATAAGRLPTSTTLTAQPSTSTVGTAVTLRATVKVLGLNGLFVTPRGAVTFTSRNLAGATANLGTASLATCLGNPCRATLTTSAMPVGTVSVTAAYSGDRLSAPSRGSTAAHVNPNPSPGTSSTVTCYAGQPCDSGTLTSSDNTTTLDVVADPSANNQTVNASLGTGTLHCVAGFFEGGDVDPDGDDDDGVFVGALATFSTTAADSSKTITYTGTGSTGDTMFHQYSEHTQFVGCYGSTTPFNGYTNGVYQEAPFVAADGLYEAMLSNCANNSGAKPCVTNVKGTGSTDSYVVSTLPGDPKLIG